MLSNRRTALFLRSARRNPHASGRMILFGALAFASLAATEPPNGAPPSNPPGSAPKAAPSLPTMSQSKPLDFPGIHNAVAYHDGFISGSAPEGDIAFDTLKSMGIRTIITVDGAVPDVAAAESRGIRYIHLPIGYNGFDEARKLQLARAVRDAMANGPVYMHCHHGKHRSAGAAGAVAVSLGWASPDAMVERMKVSGTAPNYTGLYRCTSESKPLAKETIDAVAPNFPSISKPNDFVGAMVETDEVFDHLKAIEKAGWRTPNDHPDLVPVAEAGRLADLLRHQAATPYAQRKSDEFRAWMAASQASAQRLEDELASPTPNAEAMAAAFKALGASCKDCHAKYRD